MTTDTTSNGLAAEIGDPGLPRDYPTDVSYHTRYGWLPSCDSERRPAGIRKTGIAKQVPDSSGSYVRSARLEENSGTGARELYGTGLVLIRPDQHVAWGGDDRADPSAVLSRVLGHV